MIVMYDVSQLYILEQRGLYECQKDVKGRKRSVHVSLVARERLVKGTSCANR